MVFDPLTVRPHNPRPDIGLAMQLVCPSCSTSFRINPAALGAAGKNVRCSQCRTTWFAPAPQEAPVLAVSITAAAEDNAAVAEVGIPTENVTAAEAPTAAPAVLPRIVQWEDSAVVSIETGPSLVPGLIRGGEETAKRQPEESTPPRRSSQVRKAATKKDQARSGLVAITVFLAAIVIGAIGSRTTVVRNIPDLASLYAAVGLPVNLRGLEFKDVKTTREIQEGIPVLVIEGEVVNITSHPVELPRLRLAILGSDNRELYSWTALLPRSILSEKERIPFRSRLASPPAEGHEVLVRFLNRSDLTSAAR